MFEQRHTLSSYLEDTAFHVKFFCWHEIRRRKFTPDHCFYTLILVKYQDRTPYEILSLKVPLINKMWWRRKKGLVNEWTRP